MTFDLSTPVRIMRGYKILKNQIDNLIKENKQQFTVLVSNTEFERKKILLDFVQH